MGEHQVRKQYNNDQQRNAEAKVNERKAGLLREVIESYSHLNPLFLEVSKDAYRAVMYWKKRFRVVSKKLQEEINDPSTKDSDRLVAIGKLQGIRQVFDFYMNIRSLKKEADKGEKGHFGNIQVTTPDGKQNVT